MIIDAKNLKEMYVPKKKIIVEDERFYAVPNTDEKYVLSNYARLYKLDNKGKFKPVKPTYVKGKEEVYQIDYSSGGKTDVPIKQLVKEVFSPDNTDAFLWNPQKSAYSKKRWKVDGLKTLYGRDQIVEAIRSKIEGRDAHYGSEADFDGFINQQNYEQPINRVMSRAYSAMKSRCKNKKVKASRPIYKNATICKEWDVDSEAFYQWYLDHDYFYPKKLCVDKDLMTFGEKAIYSPETCCLLPHYLNNIFQKNYSELGYSIQEKVRTNGEKYYIVPGGAFNKNKSDQSIISCRAYEECLIAARKKKANYIREIVNEERSNGYIPENILEVMEEWADRCELGLLKAWEPDPDKLRERGVI